MYIREYIRECIRVYIREFICEYIHKHIRKYICFVQSTAYGLVTIMYPTITECRSMCMPKGMGSMDPNCQGEDYR